MILQLVAGLDKFKSLWDMSAVPASTPLVGARLIADELFMVPTLVSTR